jgi:hypothetical protein
MGDRDLSWRGSRTKGKEITLDGRDLNPYNVNFMGSRVLNT